MAIPCSLAIVCAILLSCMVVACDGVTFSSLRRSLIVKYDSTQPGKVLKAGQDSITVSWSFNTTFPSGTDSSYNSVELKLCYAPISQKDRGWRKTEDELEKDKTCQHKIVSRPYSSSNNRFTWKIQKDVPNATYFVRAYAINSAHHEVAYGQDNKFLDVQAISGRHTSLDIASVCFSAFAIVSFFGFFYVERERPKCLNKTDVISNDSSCLFVLYKLVFDQLIFGSYLA